MPFTAYFLLEAITFDVTAIDNLPLIRNILRPNAGSFRDLKSIEFFGDMMNNYLISKWGLEDRRCYKALTRAGSARRLSRKLHKTDKIIKFAKYLTKDEKKLATFAQLIKQADAKKAQSMATSLLKTLCTDCSK